ncbi:hypothetical protein ACFSJ3_06790 [Corallincola platygyrae]|uniref:Uncharacterized protein n=1 Tax=Corallincola platygyrae TaxID=1193278 RepID=A0ABW4XJF4_9GAMM
METDSFETEIAMPAHVKFSQKGLMVESAKLSGDNMYMGYIPVMFEKDAEGVFVADMYLASCTQKDMRWKLTLNTVNTEGVLEEWHFVFDAPR